MCSVEMIVRGVSNTFIVESSKSQRMRVLKN